MKEALQMMGEGLDPAGLVTHIGGLNVVPETTLNPVSYTHLPNLRNDSSSAIGKYPALARIE